MSQIHSGGKDKKSACCVPGYIETLFMKNIVGYDRWLISDSATMRDIWPSNDIELARGRGQTPGMMNFNFIVKDGSGKRKKIIVEMEPCRFREKVVERTAKITSLSLPLNFHTMKICDLLKFINNNITPKVRKDIIELTLDRGGEARGH